VCLLSILVPGVSFDSCVSCASCAVASVEPASSFLKLALSPFFRVVAFPYLNAITCVIDLPLVA
jgi:hypothetical protein